MQSVHCPGEGSKATSRRDVEPVFGRFGLEGRTMTLFWEWRELNPHDRLGSTDFKSVASANSATLPLCWT